MWGNKHRDSMCKLADLLGWGREGYVINLKGYVDAKINACDEFNLPLVAYLAVYHLKEKGWEFGGYRLFNELALIKRSNNTSTWTANYKFNYSKPFSRPQAEVEACIEALELEER